MYEGTHWTKSFAPISAAEPIFSHNFALDLEFQSQYVSVSVSVSMAFGSIPAHLNFAVFTPQ
jgi:hypothetical protein